MTDDPGGDRVSLPPGTPDPRAWAGLPEDLFARVVPHVRRALADLDGLEVTPAVKRLRAVPASKLARGRSRRRVLEVLAGGGPLWVALRRRIESDEVLAEDLATALAPATVGRDQVGGGDESERGDGSDGEGGAAGDVDDLSDRLAAAEQERDRARSQRDRARDERDEARRQRDGLRGREASLQDEVDGLRDEVAALRGRVAQQEEDLATAAEHRARAVAREHRRGQAERDTLEADLAEARRELDRLRRERARRDAPEPTRGGTSPDRRSGATGPARRRRRTTPWASPDRVVPGRPSRLPAGLRLDTHDGADRLLAAVPRLLVDGYNVTRTHRGDLDLAAQRDWLVNGLAAMAARRGLDATVVFDAHRSGPRSSSARRGVRVAYSHPGVTADDEIVLAVEVLERDVPVVVVTDDRELRDRLAPARVDLLHTATFTGLLG